MSKQQETTSWLIGFILIFALTACILDPVRALSDKRLCADANCKEVISLGYGKINYPAGERGMVSFKINSPIKIKSKGAGNNPTLWGIEVNNQEGYAPKSFIRETKVLISEKDLHHLVDVEPIPSLTTTENLEDKKISIETTTAESLSFASAESTQAPLKKEVDEKFTLAGTPVQSEIVEGTKLPVSINDSYDVENNSQYLNKSEAVRESENKNLYNGIDKNDKDQNGNLEDIKIKEIENVSSKTTAIQENNFNTKLEYSTSENNLKEESISNLSIVTDKIVETTNDVIQNLHKVEDHDKGIEQEKAESKDVEAFQNPSTLDESLVRETNKEILNETELISEQNFAQSYDSGPDHAYPKNPQNIEITNTTTTLLDDKTHLRSDIEGGAKQLIYNTADSSNGHFKDNVVSDTDASGNSEHLDKKINELEHEVILKRNEIRDTQISIDQQKNLNEKPNIENPSQVLEIKTTIPVDTLTTEAEVLPYKEEQINKESRLSTNINEESKIGNEDVDIKSSVSNKIPEIAKILSDDIVLDQNTYSTTYNQSIEADIYNKSISENNIETNKQNNRGTFKVDKPYINDKRIDGAEETTHTKLLSNSNEPDSYNHEGAQTEPIYNGIQTQNNNKDHSPIETIDLSHNIEDLKNNPTNIELTNNPESDEQMKIVSDSLNSGETSFNTPSNPSEQYLNHKENTVENIKSTLYNSNGDTSVNTPPTQYDYSYQQLPQTTTPQNGNDLNIQRPEYSEKYANSLEGTTDDSKSVSAMTSETVSPTLQTEDEPPKVFSFSTPLPSNDFETKETKGLFATIMGTVNNMLNTNKKKQENEYDGEHELDRTLFHKNSNGQSEGNILQYCENIAPNGDCPSIEKNHESSTATFHHTYTKSILDTEFTVDTFIKTLASKILELSELLVFLIIAAAACLFFIFGYYCFCNSSREGSLLSKLNQLESSMLASHKENAILKHNLMSTRQKLASIEDSSFGSNDMVVSLKKELEEELVEKAKLQEQISALQKELENAADAGIELNKIVTELLSNQTGDESIISSVEDLQKQLNEQQNTIYEINASLAEKSRENSELQLLLAEQNARYETEIASLRRDNDELEHEKGNLLTRLQELKNDFDRDMMVALEGKNLEIKRLQNEIVDLTNKVENEHTKWQTSLAKVEALEECLKNVRRDPHVNITEVIDVANVKAQFIEVQKKYKSLKEKLESELDSRKLAENQLEVALVEVEKLKQDFNQSEKDKLEAQTRLEVLSNYFKDKENQLQKELSLKEAMWLKQQGETTTTVDRLTAMQEEIQFLKSQNDSLRAEIEAQIAAHKAQTGTLENRAHETWLAARQSDRRYEEARAEATALRRKLTALGGSNINDVNKPTAGPAGLGEDLTQAHSPIHMESPGSPMLGRLPPPPFLPPPFMGPPPPFLGMPPPPPFVPPGEIRPAPLGRIMSPLPQRSGRFSPQHPDFEDYLDYEGNNPWHRHTYSPPPRTYRSLSPTNSRYDYETERDLMSTYDTETDFSPPLTPRETRRRDGNSSERIDFNNEISYGNSKKFNTSNKGPISSGSEKSFKVLSHNGSKPKKGNAGGSGKTLV